MNTHQQKLEDRKERLKTLNEWTDQLDEAGANDGVVRRCRAYLEKMARTIDRTNFEIYEREIENLLEAQEIVMGDSE